MSAMTPERAAKHGAKWLEILRKRVDGPTGETCARSDTKGCLEIIDDLLARVAALEEENAVLRKVFDEWELCHDQKCDADESLPGEAGHKPPYHLPCTCGLETALAALKKLR